MSVPKKLHRVLVWGYDPGMESAGWWKRFSELHPSWELTTWSDPIHPSEWELGRLFESCGSGAQLADLLRIEILWRHGGVYVDTDVEPLKAMDVLLDSDFFIGTEDGRHITNAVMGASPGHPALRSLMDRLLEYQALPDLPPNQTTGPEFYTRVLGPRDDILVVPREVFYPYNPFFGIPRLTARSGRHAICVHHWAGSWIAPEAAGRLSQWAKAKRRASKGVKRIASTTARRYLYPSLRRIIRQVHDAPNPTHGVYVGGNRIIISTIDGFPMYALADDLSLTPELVASGWYDEQLLGFLDKALRPGDWFVDVGANLGLFSLAAASRVGLRGRVIAFEADPEVAEICRVNAGMNWLGNVTVIASAAGATDDVVELSRHPQYRGSSVAGSVDHRSRAVREGFETVVVPVRRVDGLVPAGVPLRLVKIDVEGGESDVLTGLEGLVDRGMIDYIVIEVIRGNAPERWSSLLDHLSRFVSVHEASLWTLGRRGDTLPITYEEVHVREPLTQLVIDFTRPHDHVEERM